MSLDELFDQREEREDPPLAGVVIGIVKSNQDPDGLGRIKIAFPWREKGGKSYWARIASLMAGAGRGAVFYPEEDDEVLVAFEHGDIDRPFIIGALWNGKDKPPEANSDGKNNIRKIRSRSGHEIVFNDDAEGKNEKIKIHTKSGHTVLLDDTSGKEKIEIVDKTGNNSMLFDSKKDEISVKSSMKLSIESQMIEIKSGGMMNLEASGNLIIKGAMVMIN